MKINGVILDWAGTTVDYGCFAPVHVFLDIFKELGIELTPDEVREPMGLRKWDHIAELFRLPHVAAQYERLTGRSVTDEDIDRLNDRFEPKLLEVLPKHATVNPHVAATVAQLRDRGLKIGSTTGYTSPMLEYVAEAARGQGYEPDCMVAPDDVGGFGRPHPHMIRRNMERLGLAEPQTIVKVGDTVADIAEAQEAGVWSIGIILGSSLLGLSEQEAQALSSERYLNEMERVRDRYEAAGANIVIEDFSYLPHAIARVNEKLARGERPYV